jgi:GTP-binding protein Era
MGEPGPTFRSGFVTVLGKPNVGKSTLINALVGQKVAIVSEKPQTTRHRLLGVLTRPEHQIVFIDTPGVHQPRHKLGEYMLSVTRRAVPDADVLLVMVDVSHPPSDEDEATVRLVGAMKRHHALLPETVGMMALQRPSPAPVALAPVHKANASPPTKAPRLLVGNKADLVARDQVDEAFQPYRNLGDFDAYLLISALKGKNLDELEAAIVERLPEGPPYFPADMVTDQPEQFLVAELVREQVLHLTRQEIPHSVAVTIDDWTTRHEGLVHIGATIHVEKDSQKGIIIGAGGEMLKRIGQTARQGIELLIGNKVYLELWVKVAHGWRKDEAMLRQFGYSVQK